MTTTEDAAFDRAQLELLSACLKRDGRVRLKALGNSMHPAFQHGDFIEIFVSQRTILGDTVAVVRGDKLLVHRQIWPPVAHLGRSRIWLKGDARRLGDGAFEPNECLGRARNLTRRESRIRGLVRSTLSALQRFEWIARICRPLSRFCLNGDRL